MSPCSDAALDLSRNHPLDFSRKAQTKQKSSCEEELQFTWCDSLLHIKNILALYELHQDWDNEDDEVLPWRLSEEVIQKLQKSEVNSSFKDSCYFVINEMEPCDDNVYGENDERGVSNSPDLFVFNPEPFKTQEIMSPQSNNNVVPNCDSSYTCPSPIQKKSVKDELLKLWSNEEEDRNDIQSNMSWRFLGDENLSEDSSFEQTAFVLLETELECGEEDVLVLPSLDDLEYFNFNDPGDNAFSDENPSETDLESNEALTLFDAPLTSPESDKTNHDINESFENNTTNHDINESFENKSLVEVDDQAEELNDDEKSDKSNNCDNKSNIDDSDHLVCRKVDSPLENLETLEDVEMVILGHSDIDISEVELSKIEQNNNSDTEPNNFETELMIVCD